MPTRLRLYTQTDSNKTILGLGSPARMMAVAYWHTLTPIYGGACPNCGGDICAERLERGLPCRRCLPEGGKLLGDVASNDIYDVIELVGEKLAKRGVLRGYSLLYNNIRELRAFENFFKKVVGYNLWSAQLTWAKRLLQSESIAIVAPTGVGKTTLLIAYALYRGLEGAKVYYLLPTENLVRQVVSKLEAMSQRVGKSISIVAYYSSLGKNHKEKILEDIRAGNFDILVSTTSFLSRRWELVNDKKFDVIIVDDVDAVLRNSKNIDRLLMLLGFSEETINTAYQVIKKKIAVITAKVSGNIARYTRLLEELKTLEYKLAKSLTRTIPGQLVIASATGRVRGLKPKLFRELLGFEIGRVYDYTRSITNFGLITSENELVEKTVEVIKGLKASGLVFVAKRFGKELAKSIVKRLNEEGIPAGLALAGRRVLDKFENGEYDVLVGMASYYGVIVRGVDMPHRVLYTIFVGVPSSATSAEKSLNSPFLISRLSLELGLEESEEIVRIVSRLSPGEQSVLRIALTNNERLEGRLEEVREKLSRAKKQVLRILYEKLCVEGIGKLVVGGLLFRCIDGRKLISISVDAPTYVQASGRASRMLKSSMTHGVSIVIETEPDLLDILVSKLGKFIENVEFYKYDPEKVKTELLKAKESRLDTSKAKKVSIETCLIVVESPTKARTLASFFGRPVRRRIGSVVVYETTFYNEYSGKIHVAAIAASVGHVYDLSIDDEGLYGVRVENGSVQPVYKPIKKCLSCGHSFSSSQSVCPRCGSSNIVTKEDIVAALRQLANEMERVYIATDPDIEGEKIAYDIYVMLRPYARHIKRIELHEITRKELLRALAKPRDIDRLMVNAQIVRRIEDRWIGFGLSQKLWEVFGKNWLGAGRVQTPVLGWIIDKYSEWREYRGYILYIRLKDKVRLRLYYKDLEKAKTVYDSIEKNGLEVVSISDSIVEINPPPPFTTESLLYEASRLYGYPAQKTMRLAQDLFEAGLITYHRTDSLHVSSTGISVAAQYLESKDLSQLFYPRGWGPPGHHEAIRPTKPLSADELRRAVAVGELRISTSLRESHYRLYDLIFRRFIASQMKPSKLLKRSLRFKVPDVDEYVELELYVDMITPGYTLVYEHPRIVRSFLPIKMGDIVTVESIALKRGSAIQLYGHGDVIRLMKERGLGRPSTYAKIIESIIRHGYVIESKYRKKLVPTKLGITVYDYLSSNYSSLVSEERTRKLQEEIDAIVEGKLSPLEVLSELLDEMENVVGVKQIVLGHGLEMGAST